MLYMTLKVLGVANDVLRTNTLYYASVSGGDWSFLLSSSSYDIESLNEWWWLVIVSSF